MSNWISLVKYFLIKDIKSRYAGSGLGVFWTFILPVFQILLYWFVFATIMRVRPYSNAQIPYVYFLLSTFFFWLALAESISRSGTVIIEHAEIVKKVHLPKTVLPVSITLSCYLHNMIGVIIFIFIFAASGSLHPHLFFIAAVLFLQLLFSVGLGMVMAAVVPYVRDLQQVMGYVIQGMFFLAPVYLQSRIPLRLSNMAVLSWVPSCQPLQ